MKINRAINQTLLLAILAIGMLPFTARAATANLAWDANTETDLAGYRLYYATYSLLSFTPTQAAVRPSVTRLAVPVPNLTTTASPLLVGTTYYFRLTAYDTSSNESLFNVNALGQNVEVSTCPRDNQAPTVPSALTAQAVSGTQINLAWTASTDDVGVTGYRVERCQGAGCANFTQIAAPSGTSYNNTGLTAGLLYSYRVRAGDAAGNLSLYSNVASATTPAPDVTPPTVSLSAPANGATVSGSAVVIAANASDNVGVAGVRFQVNGANLGAEDTSSPYSVTWNTTGYADGSYSLRAIARDAAGNVSTSTVRTVTVDNVIPDTTPPVISAIATNGLTSQAVTVTWTTNEPSDTQVEYGLTSSYGSFSDLLTAGVTGHSASLTGLADNTVYHYRVRSRDASGNLAMSTDRTFRTLTAPDTAAPSVPGNLTARAVSETQINLAWAASTDNVGVTGYRVERCQGAGCANFTQVGAPSGTSFVNEGLLAGILYRYRVRATDAAGNLSNYSTTASATTPTGPLESKTEPTVYPNPYRPTAGILNLKNWGENATLSVLTLMGQRVKELRVNDGEVTWDGIDEFGQPVASGVYIVLEGSGKAVRVVLQR